MASRNSVERSRGTSRAAAMTPAATRRRRTNDAGRRNDEEERDAPVGGKRDREAREGKERDRQRHEIGGPRRAADRRHLVAEERGRADLARPAEREEREGERGEEAVGGRGEQLAGIDAGDRHGNRLGEHRPGCEGNRRTDHQADCDAQSGEEQDLDEIDADGEVRRRAEAFQRGDDVALSVEIAGHGIGDADAADDQRGEADQREELGEALDRPPEPRRGIVARPRLEAGIGEGVLDARGERRHRGVVERPRQRQAIVPVDEAARLDEAGRRQRRLPDHQPRAEGEAGRQPVGLVGNDAAERNRRLAQADRVADLEPEPREKLRVGQRTEDTVTASKQRRRVAAALDRDACRRADRRRRPP